MELSDQRCPCSPERTYARCCGRFHSGEAKAPTAEALMRSRYSAFAVGDEEYLLASWHTGTRPTHLELSDSQQWLGLEILDVVAGGMLDHCGEVEFVATYVAADESSAVENQLHERSRFEREDNRWVYVDGD